MRAFAAVVLSASSLLIAHGSARACPSCDASRQARAEVLGEGFAENLATALAPFVVIGAVCAGIEATARTRGSK